jgi:hypothetical protein
MVPPPTLNVSEILDRMKDAAGIKTDAQIAVHLGVSNKTVSSWRARNSLPIETVLQMSEETGKRVEAFLFGDEHGREPSNLEAVFDFGDFRLRDFELAGESILIDILERFAPEHKAFMSDKDVERTGQDLGVSIARNLALVRQERRALLDTGKLDEAVFEDYVRKTFRIDLPYFTRAIENRMARKSKGPQ